MAFQWPKPLSAVKSHTALITIHRSYPDTFYWIDAICIDQLNDRERSEQVGIMDRIYQRAHIVEFWLGLGFDDTKHVNVIMWDIIASEAEVQKIHLDAAHNNQPVWHSGGDFLNPDHFETLVQILSRRWSHRFWTLQEFALAKRVEMRCGTVSIDVDHLRAATKNLARRKIPLTLSYGNDNHATSATILQLSLLQEAVSDPKIIQLNRLNFFRGTPQSIILSSSLGYIGEVLPHLLRILATTSTALPASRMPSPTSSASIMNRSRSTTPWPRLKYSKTSFSA